MKKLFVIASVLLSALLMSACYPKSKILQIDYYDTDCKLQHCFVYVTEQANNEFSVEKQEYYKVPTPFYIANIFEYKTVE